MELRHIKTKQCPYCGCTDIIEERLDTFQHKIHEHYCGARWETRGFACGYEVKYIPNFRAEEQVSECYTVKDKAKKEYNEFLQKILNYTDSLNYPEKFKETVKNYIQNSKYRI